MEPFVQTLYAFNWIEWIIIPIILAFMETQPLTGIFALLWLLLTGKNDTSPLTQGSILLLLLSFSWWTLLIKRTDPGGRRKKRTHGLYFLSLFLAVGGVFGTHLSLTTNRGMFLLSLAFIFLLWQQSISQAEKGIHDETLMKSFQISFFLLLVVLLFAIIDRDLRGKAFLLGLLVSAFPLFFLSSLMAFSFVHTTRAKRELTLTRFWGVGEEKLGTIESGGFDEQISTNLHKRIQAASRSRV